MNSIPGHQIFFAFCALLMLTPLAAQDVTIGAPVTFTASSDNQNCDSLKLQKAPKPKYPSEWRDTGTYGYVIMFSPTVRELELIKNNNFKSYPLSSIINHGTDRKIVNACLAVAIDWKWETAALDPSDPRRAWVPVIFNPASASASKKNAAPRLLDVVPVFVPKLFLIDKDDCVARADVTVGADGAIKDIKLTSTSKFAQTREADVVKAVSQWKIAPARNNGVPTETTINLPVLFLPDRLRSKTESKSAAQPIRAAKLIPLAQADTVYPKTMKNSQVYGHVTLEFALDDKGRPLNPVVVLSYSKEFDAPALDAIRKYRFQKPDPADPDSFGNIHENPSDARWQYDVNFDLPRPSVKGQNTLRPVLAPEKVTPVAPVYPYEMLKDNITGSATVHLPYGTGWSGDGCPDIIDASQECFGYALAAAVRSYKIKTKSVMGKPAAAMITATFDFNPANPDLHLPEKTKQLLADETNNPEKIIPEDKLDSRLKIPKGATKSARTININAQLKGTTVIEFLVDETGRVHLPRIITTEVPEAAYVLMQQISMRVYAPPLQNGRPVVARAREKVIFDATRNLSADDK